MEPDSTKNLLLHPKKLLSMVLWLAALHSCSMGIGLIVQPDSLIKFLGFESICEHFFPAQGGAFHILMGAAYFMGACNVEKYHYLIVFSVIVKAGATLFLTLYFIIVDFKWFILFCAISDVVLGLMILSALLTYIRFKRLSKSKNI